MLILLLVGGIFTSIRIFKNDNSSELTQVVDSSPEEKQEKENSNNEEMTQPEEPKEEVKTDVPKEEPTSKKEEKKDTTSTNNDVTPKTNVEKPTTYQQPQESATTSTPKTEVVEQPVTPKEEKKSYVGVPDPNNYNYSMHHGNIEYQPNQRQDCINDSIDIGFKDTVDITNAFCLDVYDSNNTLLGYYLYIKCTSGNCNKYKN